MQFIMIIYFPPLLLPDSPQLPYKPKFIPCLLKTKQTTLSLVCVGWLLLGVWPALDCDQYTKFCSIKDNWLSLT